jgi:hypothetical protein
MRYAKSFMKEERKETEVRNNDTSKPDAGTLHTTDPQENMEGPVSSSTKGLGKAFDTDQSKKEADEERDRKL